MRYLHTTLLAVAIMLLALVCATGGCHAATLGTNAGQGISTTSTSFETVGTRTRSAEKHTQAAMPHADAVGQKELVGASDDHEAVMAATAEGIQAFEATIKDLERQLDARDRSIAEKDKRYIQLRLEVDSTNAAFAASEKRYDKLYNSWHERWYRTIRNWTWSIVIGFVILQGLGIWLRCFSPATLAFTIGSWIIRFPMALIGYFIAQRINPVVSVPKPTGVPAPPK